MEGYILVNKPEGVSSFFVIMKIKAVFRQVGLTLPRIGHTGTLDPFASGLLIICIGRKYTKFVEKFQDLGKEYVVEICLGAESDTLDKTGVIVKNDISDKALPTLSEIEKVIEKFKGEIIQAPPIFSAKKINGVRAYHLARNNQAVELKAIKVNIYSIEIKKYNYPALILKVKCSKGTYIRTLAADIGRDLGFGGYAKNLCRTKIGEFTIDNSIFFSDISLEVIQKNLLTEISF